MIALYVHPKTSDHLQSHSRAIMALDHSRLSLENKFLENKSGRILRSTRLLYNILPTNMGVCKPTFYAFYSSRLRCNSTIYHIDLGQNTVFHNFFNTNCTQSTFRLLKKQLKKFPKSSIRPPVLTFDKRQICSSSSARVLE